jgi:hypothetical protein
VVESQPSKLLVAGSIPVSRSNYVRGTSSRRTPPLAVARGAPLPRSAPAGHAERGPVVGAVAMLRSGARLSASGRLA